MSYKVHTKDIVINLIPLSERIPKKAVKTQEGKVEWKPVFEPYGIIDKRETKVRFEGDKAIIQAPDTPENRKVLEIWEKIKSFEGKEIEEDSLEDEEYTRLEFALHDTELGRALLNAVWIDIETASEKLAKIYEKKEQKDEFTKLVEELEEKEKEKPWLQNWLLQSFNEREGKKEALEEACYECPQCKIIWKGEELIYNLCPKCNDILNEIYQTKLKEINAKLVSKRVRVKAVLEGEGEAKALFTKWKTSCEKCSTSVDLDFSSKDLGLNELMFNCLISEGRFGVGEVLGVLSGVAGPCKTKDHYWKIKPVEPAVDYREVYLRDELILEEKDEKGTISRNYRIILFGPSPSSQQIDGSGLVLVNPRNNALTLVIDAYEDVSLIKSAPLTEDDKALLRKYFYPRSLEKWLEDSERLVCPFIVGRKEAKLATLLTTNSPLWISLDGVTLTPGVLRTLLIGDARTGKGTIGRWYPGVVNIGLHGSAETSTRSGIGYFVDPEDNIIVWGLLVEADCGLAILEALHGFPAEHLMQLREALAQMRIMVRMKARGVRMARTRIIADANAPLPLSSYAYPCMAIKELKCFLDASIDPSRWDIYVPFKSGDVSEEEIVSVQRSEDQEFINALRRLISISWTRKAKDFIIEEEARETLKKEASKLMKEYKIEGLPLVHNGSHWSILRLAHSFAMISLSTEDFETFTIKKEHVQLAIQFLEHLYDLWMIKEYKKKITTPQLSDERFNEIKRFFEDANKARELFVQTILNPADGETLAGRAQVDYNYARQLFSKMKGLNIIERVRKGYQPTELGIQVYRRLEQSIEKQKKEEFQDDCVVCGKITKRWRAGPLGKPIPLCSEECEERYEGKV
jgi:DNA replicative helicase MCM subunit Mcm2 (Cdc46/Mcm family)